MMRLNLLLLLAVLASALYLVSVQYDSRRLFSELDRSRLQARQLAVDKEQLQVEKRAQTTPARIERLAKQHLQMHNATPAITHYVGDGAASPAAQSAGNAASQPPSAAAAGRVQ